MDILSSAALWFFPFVLPLCVYTCYTDMRELRITNRTVVTLFLVFVLIGPLALPFEDYLWRYAHFGAVLVAGMALNAARAMGAGDAKFAAAAAPFIHIGDLRFLMVLFSATLLAAYASHRMAKYTPLRKFAPEWKSWSAPNKKFPMGLALGGTLAIYLGLGILYGK